MNILLQDTDALQLMAAQLTREQAGLRLASVCKYWLKFVRVADAAAVAGAAEFWRAVPRTWSLERVLPRIDRFCTASMWWGLEEENRGLLNAFAGNIDVLREEGVVELVFDKALARRGKKASLMGCHTLKVLDMFQFLSGMHGWVNDTQRGAGMSGQGFSELEGWDTPSDDILDLLRRLGLKRRRVTRKQPRRMVWFPADKQLAKNEPLWHRAYVA
jgi:hypothetical protein